MENMEVIKVRLTLLEEMLGTACANPNIHAEYIASKAPDAPSMEEEIASIGVDGVIGNAMTVFSKDDEGNPILWDYQIKGFFKDACSMLRKVPGSESGKVKAYKKEIDGLIFIGNRQIPIQFDGKMGNCQRSLRAQTPQGDRVALANSETVPAGSVLEFEIWLMAPTAHRKVVMEWLDYGRLRGLGQWRNSGKGKFTYEVVE